MGLGVERAVAEIIRDGDPARGIQGLLALRGWQLYDHATVADRHILIGEELETPDDAVTVLLEGGGPPIGGGAPNALLRQPGFTVRSRAPEYDTAQEIAHQVHAILDYFEGSANSVPFFRIFASFEPVPLGRDRGDRGGRWVFSQTYRSVTKRYTPS